MKHYDTFFYSHIRYIALKVVKRDASWWSGKKREVQTPFREDIIGVQVFKKVVNVVRGLSWQKEKTRGDLLSYVISIGEMLIDFIPERRKDTAEGSDACYHPHPEGAPAN